MSSTKKILLVCRKPPYGDALSREAIDIALAATAFDQDLTLLFSGDGVWQLLDNQRSDAIESKNHAKVLSALPLYDISDIYIDEESLQQRNLTPRDLVLEGKSLSTDGIKQLSQRCDVIFNF